MSGNARLPTSPGAAFGWEYWRRHRWGLMGLASYMLALGVTKVVFTVRGYVVTIEYTASFALFVMVPLSASVLYVLAVFTFGLSGDFAARQSTYPTRLFTLPVSTAALAWWPMLYGTLAMGAVWLALRLFAVWPVGFDIPWIWPVLLGAALLVWTQALAWMPYGLPGLRVILIMVVLTLMDVAVLLALHFEAGEAVMVAILAPLVPLGFVVARAAVARARRGAVPDWRGMLTRLPGMAAGPAHRRQRPFSSAVSAQAWFEWRRYGRQLPAMVGILLPFELALLFAARDAPVLVFAILLCVLVTPPFMAAFVATTLRKSSAGESASHGMTPFVATRPLSGPALVGAKLRMAMWSTLAAWTLVAVAVPAGLAVSDTWPIVKDIGRDALAFLGMPRLIVLLLLIVVGFMASTWKQLVQTLYVGLTGREWIVKGSVYLTLAVLSVLGPIVDLILNNGRVRAELWDAIPAILAALVAVKTGLAGWVAVRISRSGLLSDRVLVLGAGAWCAAVLALYGVLAWFFSTPFFPRYLLLLVAILAMPLARVSAAPLVLAWNRHR